MKMSKVESWSCYEQYEQNGGMEGYLTRDELFELERQEIEYCAMEDEFFDDPNGVW